MPRIAIILLLFTSTSGLAQEIQMKADDRDSAVIETEIQAMISASEAAVERSINQRLETAQHFHDQKRYAEAEPIYLEVLEDRENAFGKEHPKTLDAVHSLAIFFHNQKRYGEAEPLYLRALKAYERSLGEEHPTTILSLSNLALMYNDQGRYYEAEPLHLRTVETRERTLGSNDLQTLDSLNSLAMLYYHQGRYTEAEPLYLQVLEAYERIVGEEHPTTLNAVNSLTVLYSRQGRFEEAETLYLRALEAYERTLGKNHSKTMFSVNNLALIYGMQGRYGDAEPLLLRALEVRERTLGKDHPDTLRSVHNLGLQYFRQGRYEEVEPLYLRALDGHERTLGKEHPVTLFSVNNLAEFHQSQMRYKEAEILYLRVSEARERLLGKEHPDTLFSINNLAQLYDSLERFSEAEPLYLRALDVRERTLGKEHPDALLSANNLAEFYSAQERYSEAETLFLQALIGRLRTLRPDNIYLADSYQGMGELLVARDNDILKATYFLKKTVNVLQGVRQNMSELESGTHRAFLDKWKDSYLILQRNLVQIGRFAEAEQVGRMLKETEYLAFVRGSSNKKLGDALVLTQSEKDWENQLAIWMERPNRLAGEIEVMRTKQRDDGKLSTLEQRQLTDLETAYDKAYGEFRDTVNGWLGDVRALADDKVQEEARALELASAERMQGVIADIGPDVALLQLVAFEDSLHMFLTTPQAFKHVAVPVGRTDLFEAIFEARQEIELGRDPNVIGLPVHDANLRQRLGALYDWLIKPVADDLADAETKTLMLNLQGQIRYVPFAALWDGNGWLTERYQLALFTPAAQTRFDPPASMRNGVAFGLSEKTEGFSALPAVPDELTLIMGDEATSGVLDGDFRINDQFTRASFEASLTKPAPVLHIASHFAIRPGDEAASFLVLGDGSHLTLSEINRSSKLRFRGVELLTLSACETALGGNGTGMEIEGMGALAQNKGAGSVLATLWQVADDTTPSFMRDFYSGIVKEELTKAGALRAAQINMIGSQLDNDPFYWAPFIIMGNWK